MPVGQSSLGIPYVLISNSGTVTTSSATPNLKTATTFGRIPACEAVSLYLYVTTNSGTGGANTFWVELQQSPDNGTTWLPTARFTQVTTSAATHVLNFRTNGIGANEAAATTTGIQTVTAAVTQNVVLGPDQRFVWTLGNAGQSVTFGVFGFAQQSGSRAAY